MTNDILAKRIADLGRQLSTAKSERDALAAHVEHIRAVFRRELFNAKGLAALENAIESTSQQCLRDVQAEAGRKGFIAGFSHCFNYVGDMNIHELSIRYAESVRQGGAE